MKSTPLETRVCTRQGKPVLLVNGKKTAPLIYALANAPGGRRSWEEVPAWNIKNFAEQGFTLFQMPLWFREIWNRDGELDMETARRQVKGVVDLCPSAAVFLRIIISAPVWWLERYPEECTLYADGPLQPLPQRGIRQSGGNDLERVPRASLASQTWWNQAEEKLREFCRLLAATPEGDRVAGLHVADGVYHEWHYWGFIDHEPDLSAPMTTRFRAWLTGKYGDDARLQKAWDCPVVSLGTAQVPGMEERSHPRAGIFRDPRRERPVLDYTRCQHEVVAESIIRCCRAVKDSWPRPIVTGVFYGYFFTLFGRQAAGGHLAADTVLSSSHVDYLSAPQSYFRVHRMMGGTGQSRGLLESCRLHGKLWLDEMDQATHRDVLRPDDISHVNRTLEESITIVRRNMAAPFTRGMGMWFFDFGPTNVSGWWDYPPMLEDIGRLKTILERYYGREYVPQADVLVVYDTDVFCGMAGNPQQDPVTDPLCVNLASTALFHTGMVCDMVYLADLERVEMERYRAVIFANTFCLTDRHKDIIRTRVAAGGRHLIWNYAPGYSDGQVLDPAFIREVTGITVEERGCPATLVMTAQVHGKQVTTDYQEPAYNRLYNQFHKPDPGKLGGFRPFFGIRDEEAEILAHWQGPENIAAIACRQLEGWTSWYCSLPVTDATLLREVLRASGAHIYNEHGDTLYAGNGILVLHTAAGGNRNIRLRNGTMTGRTLSPASTVILDSSSGEVLLA